MSANLMAEQMAELLHLSTRSPVNEGLKEIRKVMQPTKVVEPSTAKGVVHKVVLTNGTGGTERVGGYAELERRSY